MQPMYRRTWRPVVFILGLIAVAIVLVLVGYLRGTRAGELDSRRPAPVVVIPSGPPIVRTVAELAQAPALYDGEYVQVTGLYRQPPVVACDSRQRLSPARWALSEGEDIILAAGFDEQLRPLIPVGLTLTVEGTWRTWRGPIGCGKDAPLQTVWYVAVSNIVAPSPIARVTLTPGGAPLPTLAGTIDPLVTAAPTPQGTPPTSTATSEPAATEPTATATAAEAGTATATIDVAFATATNVTPAVTATSSGEATATATAAPTEGTVLPSATPGGEASPTATPEVTATPGETPVPGTVTDKGELEYQNISGDRLSPAEAHNWGFVVSAGDIITISVASAPNRDLSMEIFDASGASVVTVNSGGPGEVERLVGYQAPSSGTFRVHVRETSNLEAHYLLMLLSSADPDYYNFIFVDTLEYGETRDSEMAAETDQFWFFRGTAGETIDILIAPNDNTDLFFDMFDPLGEQVVEFVDNGAAGEPEELLNYSLPATGIYGIRVGELAFAASSFTITVSRN